MFFVYHIKWPEKLSAEGRQSSVASAHTSHVNTLAPRKADIADELLRNRCKYLITI